MSKRIEFGVIALVALLAACYAPPPQINAVLLGVLSGLSMGGALLWKRAAAAQPGDTAAAAPATKEE